MDESIELEEIKTYNTIENNATNDDYTLIDKFIMLFMVLKFLLIAFLFYLCATGNAFFFAIYIIGTIFGTVCIFSRASELHVKAMITVIIWLAVNIGYFIAHFVGYGGENIAITIFLSLDLVYILCLLIFSFYLKNQKS